MDQYIHYMKLAYETLMQTAPTHTHTHLEPLVEGEEAERDEWIGHEEPVDELLDHINQGVEGAVCDRREGGAVLHQRLDLRGQSH